MGGFYHAARALLNVLGMRNPSVAKVICFRCRLSDCSCVAGLNHREPAEPGSERSQLGRALAWLGGACLAGSALGAGLAFLLGG